MPKPFFLAALLLVPAQGMVRAEEPSRLFAVGDRGAILMGPPEVAAGAFVKSMHWTADGTGLVVQRLIVPDGVPAKTLLAARRVDNLAGVTPLSRRTEIVGWSPKSGKTRLLFAFDPTQISVDDLAPIPNGDRFHASIRRWTVDSATGARVSRQSYLILAAGSGVVTNVEIPPAAGPSYLWFSPTGLGVMVQENSSARTSTVAVLGSDGRLGRAFPLPPDASFGFREDGVATVTIYRRIANKATYEVRRFDPRTGTLGPTLAASKTAEESVEATPEAASPGALGEASRPPMMVGEIVMSPQSRGVALMLFPGKREGAGIVTADGTNPLLSPKNDAVAYLSGGSAFVRRLTPLSMEEFRVAEAEAERARAMDQAKQIGLALSMYSQDADDVMPPSGADVKETVQPYARNRSVFDGFVYTFGGALPPGDRGSVTLGYIPVIGGQVVVYGDGTVRFVPDGG